MEVSRPLQNFSALLLVYFIISVSGIKVEADGGVKFDKGEGYLEDSCFFLPPSGSSSSCYWNTDEECDTRAAWQLSNQLTQLEIDSGLTDDHSPSSDGYMWVLRRTREDNYTDTWKSTLEKRVRGEQSRIFTFWYLMSAPNATLLISLIPLTSNKSTSCDVTQHTVLYTLHGSMGNDWTSSGNIPISDCQHYKILITGEITLHQNTSQGVIALDDFYFTASKDIKQMAPSPFIVRSEICWNDASYVLSKSDASRHECCCKSGFGGDNCQTNLDECELMEGNQLCSNGATCLDMINGFTCLCSPGYQGIHCQIDKDDCEGVICDVEAKCRDMVNDYQCECPPGYSGKRCEEKRDLCQDVVCHNGGSCVPLYDNYACDCMSGYSGRWCEEDLDVCQLTMPCGDYGTCIDGPGQLYWCLCPPGLVATEGEKGCIDDHDSCKSSPCAYDGRCEDTPLGYKCHCIPGSTGYSCELDIDECMAEVCHNGGTCVNGRGSYHCTCALGYEGTNCEKDVRRQLCVYKCKNTDVCTYDQKVTCVCPHGFTGEFCEQRINQCTYNPCVEGRCQQDLLSMYTCECNNGWTGRHCDTVIDYCDTYTCFPNSRCYSTHNGPICVCNEGYTGSACDVRLSPCDQVNCLNGGTCSETGKKSRSFHCSCSDFYVGKYCEIEIAASQMNEGNVKEVKVIAQGSQQSQLGGGRTLNRGGRTLNRGGRTLNRSDNLELADVACRDFSTLPQKLRTAILTVCISVLLVVLSLGCIIIELSARSVKRKSLQPAYSTPHKLKYPRF